VGPRQVRREWRDGEKVERWGCWARMREVNVAGEWVGEMGEGWERVRGAERWRGGMGG